jgi:DNA-binding FadR family transcriptional regulator
MEVVGLSLLTVTWWRTAAPVSSAAHGEYIMGSLSCEYRQIFAAMVARDENASQYAYERH